MILQHNRPKSYDLVTLTVIFLDHLKEQIGYSNYFYLAQMSLRAIISFIQVICLIIYICRGLT